MTTVNPDFMNSLRTAYHTAAISLSRAETIGAAERIMAAQPSLEQARKAVESEVSPSRF